MSMSQITEHQHGNFIHMYVASRENPQLFLP